MGTIGNTGRLASFRSSLFTNGLDLSKSDIRKALGVYKAKASATFRAGQFVMLNSDQEVDLSDGQNILGIAKWNKMTLGKSIKVDEPISFATSGGTATLSKSNISNLSIRSAVEMGGTLYTVTTDYTVNTTSGVITHVATIPTGTTVYATYTYDMTAADHAREGTNFLNSQDDVTLHEGRITVITDWALLFTAEYDTSRQYALSGADSNLYVTGATYTGGQGILTNLAPTNYVPASGNGVGRFVGKVMQLPNATDGFLGVLIGGSPVAVQAAGSPGVLV